MESRKACDPIGTDASLRIPLVPLVHLQPKQPDEPQPEREAPPTLLQETELTTEHLQGLDWSGIPKRNIKHVREILGMSPADSGETIDLEDYAEERTMRHMNKCGEVKELSAEAQQGLDWSAIPRCDIKRVRMILGMPPTDSTETIDSENYTEEHTLRQMTKGGLFSESKELRVETGQTSKDSSMFETAAGYELNSLSSGSANVVESESDDSLLKCLSTLSLTESKSTLSVSSEKIRSEKVSETLSKLSLDDLEKPEIEISIKNESTSVYGQKVESLGEANGMKSFELESKKHA